MQHIMKEKATILTRVPNTMKRKREEEGSSWRWLTTLGEEDTDKWCTWPSVGRTPDGGGSNDNDDGYTDYGQLRKVDVIYVFLLQLPC